MTPNAACAKSTAADAIYIDNTYADLPSSLAGLSYSLKIYRHRVRANNEWRRPQIFMGRRADDR